MTDLTLTRGDSRNYRVTITDSVTSNPIDITNGILRFAIKRHFDQPNSSAIVFKTSYAADEIEITDGPNGECLVKVLAGDTHDTRPADYSWDLDLTRRGSLVSSSGTISVTSGSAIITGSGLVLDDVLPGDVLAPSGGTSPNQLDLVIIAVGGDGSDLDPGAGNLLTDYSGWDTESGFALNIYRGDRKTPTSLSGTFTISKDVAT